MHACGRILAIGLLMLALPLSGLAEDARRVYGGRGEDRLLEIAEAGGGLFAVGTTASSDGDLSVRTRSGETGWAMRIGESGERLWSYASARSGMTRMIDPVPLDDGRYSLLLTDAEGQRCDWILLDSEGKLLSRAEVSLDSFGMGEGFRVMQMLLCGQSTPQIAVIAQDTSDGAVCAVMLDELGRSGALGRFLPDGAGIAVSDRRGALAWIGVQLGCMTVTRLAGDMESASVRFAEFDVVSVSDALMQDDGSVVCCGEAQTERGAAGFAARVSREGEVLFAHVFLEPQRHVCQTETGYAVSGAWEAGTSVAFLDEDGGLLGEAPAETADVLDIAGAPGGCALLTHIEGYRQKQAEITLISQAGSAEIGLLDMPEGEAQSPAHETSMPETHMMDTPAPEIAVGSGYLLCGGDKKGVQVTLMDGAGQSVWSTRIPIHTAADALEWCCAAWLEDGSVFLGGRYLTGEGEAARQRGAIALLSSDGVLRRVEELPGAGAVVGAEWLGGAVRLHVSRSETADLTMDDYIDMML